ncbi:MAG TPA: succinylglutamate desuccinylase/aspartoacylase family protein [Candidatus Paceibacterota bacterium]|nr:succinylglutamate desuccinylase/aspartoacylase family protein [Candidatus Paceibacterota bacterium]
MISQHVLSIPRTDGPGIDVPYFEIVGAKPGPHLTVIAGIHGAEYSSIAAAREFVAEINDQEVIGRITVMPIVNVLAFWARVPFVIPVDNQNLNRAFPGKENGSFTDIYAFHIFEKIIKGSDYLLDMHAGDIPEALEPFSIFEESPVEEKSLWMARAYGIKHIVRQRAAGIVVAGSTSGAASAIGIPAFIAESGENGILDPAAVKLHLTGLRNLARVLGVLSGDPLPERGHILYDDWNWLRAESGGWWQPAHKTGSDVKAADLLGTLGDPWGKSITEIRAPQDGTVLFQTSSPAVVAGGILVGLALR